MLTSVCRKGSEAWLCQCVQDFSFNNGIFRSLNSSYFSFFLRFHLKYSEYVYYVCLWQDLLRECRCPQSLEVGVQFPRVGAIVTFKHLTWMWGTTPDSSGMVVYSWNHRVLPPATYFIFQCLGSNLGLAHSRHELQRRATSQAPFILIIVKCSSILVFSRV